MIKSIKIKTSLAVQIVISTSKWQFFMINKNKWDYYQMPILMTSLLYYLVKLILIIMQIAVMFLTLTNVVLIFSCLLKVLNNNILT